MKLILPLFLLIISCSQPIAQPEKHASMQDWTYPFPVHHQLISDSINIAYIDQGKGERTLLFLHGLGSYLKAWTKNIEELSKDYRCVAIDLPGYGKSGKANYPYTMTFFAQTVRAFIDSLGLENITLVGHSMGGQIAMTTVLQDSSQMEQLILVAPAGFEQFTEPERQWFNNFYTSAFIKATPEEQIRKNFKINFFQMPDDAQFMIEDRLFMRKTIEYDDYCEMIPQCVQGMLKEPVFEQLPNITLPTLVLFGENDYLIPNKILHPALTTLQVAEGGAEKFPNSSLKMIPQAGHFLQWEQAELVNQMLKDFIQAE